MLELYHHPPGNEPEYLYLSLSCKLFFILFLIALSIVSMLTDFLLGLCNLQNRSSPFLEIGLMIAPLPSVTVISILSPACKFRDSLIFLGIVTCPLVVSVVNAMTFPHFIIRSYLIVRRPIDLCQYLRHNCIGQFTRRYCAICLAKRVCSDMIGLLRHRQTKGTATECKSHHTTRAQVSQYFCTKS